MYVCIYVLVPFQSWGYDGVFQGNRWLAAVAAGCRMEMRGSKCWIKEKVGRKQKVVSEVAKLQN